MLIHEDDSLAVFNKPSGIDSEDVIFFQNLLEYQVKLFVVHRLDKRAQGLILFAKNAGVAALLSEGFKNETTQKTYHAVVGNAPNPLTSTLENWIEKNSKLQKAFVVQQKTNDAKLAKLQYSTVKQSIKYSLLEIQLHTGRFHQIRAQLAYIKSPIVGDVKYGFKRTVADGSIFLQASGISFKHPISKKNMNFTIPLPTGWAKYGFE
ncbi:MAG: RluA family pseudouridine synthase [Chitinophagaceae bacterium]|jgi:23S rRNA pseudouridine1911/1915/1917 synthase